MTDFRSAEVVDGHQARPVRDFGHDPHADRDHRRDRRRRPRRPDAVPPAGDARASSPSSSSTAPAREIEETHRAGILEQDTVRLLVDSGVSDRVLRDGDAHDGIELAFGGERHRIDFRALVGRVVLALPADRGVQGPRRRARPRRPGRPLRRHARSSVVDIATPRPGVLFTDADGVAHELAATTSSARTGPAASAAGGPGVVRAAVLPRVPLRLVRHPVRGAAQRAGADLQPLRAGFRADQPAHPHRAAHVLPVRPATPMSPTWSDDRIWEELQARLNANGHTLHEGPITSRATCCGSAASSQEPMRHGHLAARRRRRAHRAAHRREGHEPRARRRQGARRGARARAREEATLAARRLLRGARWAGSGRPSTSPAG